MEEPIEVESILPAEHLRSQPFPKKPDPIFGDLLKSPSHSCYLLNKVKCRVSGIQNEWDTKINRMLPFLKVIKSLINNQNVLNHKVLAVRRQGSG